MANPSVGAALEITEILLGGPVVEQETNPATGAAAIVAIDGNGDRVGLVMVNQGGFDIFVSANPAVSGTNGIRLTSNGGSLSLTVHDDFTMAARRWYAISPGGASSLYVLEYWRFNRQQAPQPGAL